MARGFDIDEFSDPSEGKETNADQEEQTKRIVRPNRKKSKDSILGIAERTALAMRASAPLISRVPTQSRRLIQKPSTPETAKKTPQINISLPMVGSKLELLLFATGLKSLQEVLIRFSDIAKKENLDISISGENSKIEVSLSLRSGFKYTSPLKPETLAFIQSFEYERS